MVQTKEFFEKMLADLELQFQKANKELSACPEGNLVQCKRGNKITYFQVTNVDGKRKRRGITRNAAFVKLLVRKYYLKEEVKILEDDIKALKAFLIKYEEPYFENINKKVPERLKLISEQLFSGDKDTWALQSYRQSTYKPEKRRHITSRGLKVRSKSELIIAEKLYEHDIQFRYEQILPYENTEFAPDFTIRSPAGKIIYWEHCGMTSDEGYVNYNRWKLKQYDKMGIVPWDNLIVTYDSEDGILNIPLIESEIINKLKR